MDWLNYHHLYYFSVIAEEGGVSRAARRLKLTHSTLSTQLRALEADLGSPLFERLGKRLILTSFGSAAAAYAADIFRLGAELKDSAHARGNHRQDVLRIGALAGVPKTLVHHFLAPTLDLLEGSVSVRVEPLPNLVEALASGRIHAILSNELPGASSVAGAPIHAHVLGETDVLLYATAALAKRARRDFPLSLQGLPLVAPPTTTPIRRALDEWLARRGVRMNVTATVDDAGVLRAFGAAGRGVFPVRAALRSEFADHRGLSLVGRCTGAREVYYVLSSDRRIKHPALSALVNRARGDFLRAGSSAPSGPRRPARPGRRTR